MPNSDEPIPIISNLKGKEYSSENLNGIIDALKGASADNIKHAMGL